MLTNIRRNKLTSFLTAFLLFGMGSVWAAPGMPAPAVAPVAPVVPAVPTNPPPPAVLVTPAPVVSDVVALALDSVLSAPETPASEDGGSGGEADTIKKIQPPNVKPTADPKDKLKALMDCLAQLGLKPIDKDTLKAINDLIKTGKPGDIQKAIDMMIEALGLKGIIKIKYDPNYKNGNNLAETTVEANDDGTGIVITIVIGPRLFGLQSVDPAALLAITIIHEWIHTMQARAGIWGPWPRSVQLSVAEVQAYALSLVLMAKMGLDPNAMSNQVRQLINFWLMAMKDMENKKLTEADLAILKDLANNKEFRDMLAAEQKRIEDIIKGINDGTLKGNLAFWENELKRLKQLQAGLDKFK